MSYSLRFVFKLVNLMNIYWLCPSYKCIGLTLNEWLELAAMKDAPNDIDSSPFKWVPISFLKY